MELLAEDGEGRLAVQALGQVPPNLMDRLVEEFEFERYENVFVFGWVPRHALADIAIERAETVTGVQVRQME
ncbi:hypothetical protein E4J89_18315 [Arthrobacter sp. CAU 1506]|uniref:hypothetical protein n=1 Tax=Arthrobacter sp. CAU 1506 TaxID=2560052 RepID=UPI0010AC6FC2|nr:hypothetical protein [Arthrobacter sp. CAU 1506]TJY64653.1 hypothetical protein E4J89_18315 [Arthrobacter sp. CAU 1506]